LKVHNILAIPSLLYDCEIQTLKQRSIKSLKTAEMKFMRRTAGHSLLDHRNSENISEGLQ